MDKGLDTLRGVDLNLFHALHLLLEEGSVTAAARRARVSQPTMSRWLQGLRDLTNDPILVREGRRMVPTTRALAVRHQLAEALSGLEAVLEGRPFFDPATSERTLTLAIGDFSAAWFVPALLRRLHASAPRISLRVVPMLGDHDERLSTGEVDLLLARSTTRIEGAERIDIAVEELVGVARPGHAFGTDPPGLDAWLQAAHVVLDSPATTGDAVEAILVQHGAQQRIAVHLPYYLALPRVVRELDLVGTLPSRIGALLSARGEVCTFPLPAPLPPYTLQLLWSVARTNDPVVTWFREEMVQQVRETYLQSG